MLGSDRQAPTIFDALVYQQMGFLANPQHRSRLVAKGTRADTLYDVFAPHAARWGNEEMVAQAVVARFGKSSLLTPVHSLFRRSHVLKATAGKRMLQASLHEQKPSSHCHLTTAPLPYLHAPPLYERQ